MNASSPPPQPTPALAALLNRLPGHWSIRFHALIAAVIVLSMASIAALLIWQSWRGTNEALAAAATQYAVDVGALVNEKARRILGPAEVSLRHLTYDPLAGATDRASRLARMTALADVLAHNPLISAAYVGYLDGSFILLRPLDTAEMRRRFSAPPKATFLVQHVDRHSDEDVRGEWIFLTADLREVEVRRQADYRFDPRTRTWFRNAERVSGQQLTQPYVFFSTEQTGLTLSERSREGRAVVGVDLTLADLGAEMGAIRPTPRTLLAVVDEFNRVVALPQAGEFARRVGDELVFKTLDEVNVQPLAALAKLPLENSETRAFESVGESWFGTRLPFELVPGSAYRVLVAIPDSDLLTGMRTALHRQALLGLGLAAVLLPLGWLAGREIGRTISRLTRQGRDYSRFRFQSASDAAPSRLREVRDLDSVLAQMGKTLQNFLGITETIGREPQTEVMLDKVLARLVEATHCHQGAVYLLSRDGAHLELTATSRNANGRGDVADAVLPASLPVSEGLAWTDLGEVKAPRSDATTVDDHGEAAANRTSRLTLKLNNRQRNLLGLVVLQFDDDARHATDDFRDFAERLSSALEVSIETRGLIDAQRKLFDAVIQLLADAIDAKSPYTGGHCERVPELAEMMLDRLNAEPGGQYENRWNNEQRYEFRLGAWLHDAGKITSPEHIIDKATKLETIRNRIHEIRLRFEVLHRDATIAYWQERCNGGDAAQLERQMLARQRALQEDFRFVASCNIGSEAMDESAVARLQQVAQQTWTRHFDDRLGLSAEELRRLTNLASRPLPAREQLLADLPEHIVPWGARRPPVERNDPANQWGFDMKLPTHERNLGELYNLCVRRGTLTEEDRFRINDHIVQTLIMLRSLPWPQHLSRVPEIAATHHEKLDGTGYPRRLDRRVLTVEDRIMAIADIFEALTAADRPYKAAKPLSEAMRIMAQMARDQHICPEIFAAFVRNGVWLDFAHRFLRPEQVDSVDREAILALAGAGVTQ